MTVKTILFNNNINNHRNRNRHRHRHGHRHQCSFLGKHSFLQTTFLCCIVFGIADIIYATFRIRQQESSLLTHNNNNNNSNSDSLLNIPKLLSISSFLQQQPEGAGSSSSNNNNNDIDDNDKDHRRQRHRRNRTESKLKYLSRRANRKQQQQQQQHEQQSYHGGKSHIVYLPNDQPYNTTFSFSDNSSSKSKITALPNRPTFLFGIPSIANRWERRQLIRETYLSTYRGQQQQQYHDDYDSDRICFVGNYTPNCQIAYAFFIGRHPPVSSKESDQDATTFIPTELLEPNETYPISVPLTESLMDELGLDKDHDTDVVVLNIRENQMDGKMPTWFKYASIINNNNSTDNGPIFDYIAKVDDDTLVLVPNFLEYMKIHLPNSSSSSITATGTAALTTTTNNNHYIPPPPRRIYGGMAFDSSFCNPAAPDGHNHPCPLPLVSLQDTHANYHNIYMSGEFSFMSWDLARYFTDTTIIPNDRRKNVTIRQHEDVSLSNYVFSVVIPPPAQPFITDKNTIIDDTNNQNNNIQDNITTSRIASSTATNNSSSLDIISVLKIPQEKVLTKDRLSYGGGRVSHPFSKTLWCHSVSTYGGYFKDEDNVRDFWQQYMDAWKTNFETDEPRDPYQLLNPTITITTSKNNINDIDKNDSTSSLSSSLLVHPKDYIYRKIPSQPDTSPVILQEYKLIFFIVPGAGDRIWKNVLLRMQIHAGEAIPLENDGNYNNNDNPQQQEQQPRLYRLKRLNDFSITEANDIMTNNNNNNSNQYTLAMMVRNPMERLIDIYDHYIPSNTTQQRIDWFKKYCGCHVHQFVDFIKIIDHCRHILWRPQGQRMEPKYYDYFFTNNSNNNNTYILHYYGSAKDNDETTTTRMEEEIKGLFQRIGAWEEVNDNNGGRDVDVSHDSIVSSIMLQFENEKTTSTGSSSSTFTKKSNQRRQQRQFQEKLNYPLLKTVAKTLYHWDYNHPLFNFSLEE